MPVRLAIEARTGGVRAARTVGAGLNSQLAVALETEAGTVFVKGLRADHPGAVRQGREAMINPHVRAVAPRLLWHDQAAGWDLLAFEYIGDARHADYRPGSPDLPRVIGAMHRWPHQLPGPASQTGPATLGRVRRPRRRPGPAGRRCPAAHGLQPAEHPPGPGPTWIIDWAWPTRGAAFIDAACFLIRAMADRPQRQPGRGTGRPVPGLAACPVRRHRRLCSRQHPAIRRDRP